MTDNVTMRNTSLLNRVVKVKVRFITEGQPHPHNSACLKIAYNAQYND